jgi:nucleoside-diphosphate-sugar epimerase
MAASNRRLLLTGGGGFIGRQAVERARARGFEVHAVVRATPAAPANDVTYHVADLLDARAAAACVRSVRASHLLHLAWAVEPGRFWTSLDNYRWVAATLDLALAFADAGGRRIVGVGTGFEYAVSGAAHDERSSVLEPATPYAVAKDATRRLLESLAASTDLSFAWGRVFLLYGPGEASSRLVASVCRALLRGEPARCSEGTHVRDFLHVRDTADALVALTASDVEGPVNIASGAGVPVRAVVEEAARQIGRPELVQFGALPARAEPPHQVAKVTRLGQEVGWSPSFTLASGIADTIAWHRHKLEP